MAKVNKIDVSGLACGLGATWGLSMLFVGWLAAFLGYGTGIVEVMSSIYIGFTPTFIGGIVGGVYGFIDGAIGGALIALFYNWFVKKK